MARPSKLTPEVQQRIVQALTAGNTRETVARYAGIDPASFYGWLKRGEAAGSGPYFEFFNAVKKAESDATVHAVAIIHQAMPKNWQAAAWFLERRYPDDWGRKDRVTIEHQLQQEAERIAVEMGLDKDQVLVDAQRILTRGR